MSLPATVRASARTCLLHASDAAAGVRTRSRRGAAAPACSCTSVRGHLAGGRTRCSLLYRDMGGLVGAKLWNKVHGPISGTVFVLRASGWTCRDPWA